MQSSKPLPNNFEYVMLSVAVSWFMNMYLLHLVISMTRKSERPPGYRRVGNSGEDFARELGDHESVLKWELHKMQYLWAPVMILALMCGVEFPVTSAICMMVFNIGRVVYGYEVASFGLEGIKVGRILGDSAQFSMFLLTIYGGLSWGGWVVKPALP
eukprot:GEMP01056574.1.p1 GENE.GEMP01056574.1~~GEMP01056574.1.p1  ORF type:complete len:157 (+),score=34.29 GEMP01056574.1:85-555(+)